jgi:queuine tRNA-ribosyltransferase
VVRTAGGEISIRNNVVNEIMHNPVGPWSEANLLYISASGFRNILTEPTDHPLIIYDVGLGAAANALAALTACHEVRASGRPCRPLTIVSFENDLSLLEFVISAADRIPYVTTHASTLATLLAERLWRTPEGEVEWILHEGNFLDTAPDESRCPEIVFFDPYSPGVNAEMWTREAFSRIYDKTEGGTKRCSLYTYSRATPVRTAMLSAGFFVGSGPRSGLKDETTQAATARALLREPLDERWLLRWLRSHTKFPAATAPELAHALTNAVLAHPQFADQVYQALLGWRRLTLVH